MQDKKDKALFGVFANISNHDLERALKVHLRDKVAFPKGQKISKPENFKALFSMKKTRNKHIVFIQVYEIPILFHFLRSLKSRIAINQVNTFQTLFVI